MSLGYYTPVQSGATARYSGDISSWAWTQYGQTAKAYAFSYDGAHRLTAGQYYSGGSATNALSEKSITYDRAGNITAITRYNNAGAATTLNYSYAGNRLSSIGTASYAYDTDGNLTTDGRRGISLTYNLLGQPAGVSASVGGTAKASYTYLSDESKAGVANGSNGYWYLGSFVYNRSKVLESVAFGGGRILKNGSAFLADYHISDHLGSVRAVVRNGSVIEQNDYFPFGSRHDNGMASQSDPVANRFRYNGKELQTTGSLGYLDYGARFYDPDIARWNAVDSKADIQKVYSPYAFCGGDPVLHVDNDGKIFETAWDVASLVMGVKSFVQNVKEGNTGAAIMDGVGIIGDALAIATPIVPGGVSAGIAAVRAGKNIDHAVDAAKTLDRAGDLAKTTDKTSNVVNVLNKTDNTEKTYQTYMKVNKKTGEVYIGRTGGAGSPRENVLKRDRNHHMYEKGYGPAVLINSSKNQDAIRGQEQYLIDLFGGAKSNGGNAGNAINGVSPTNPKRRQYEEARLKEFGQ